MTLLRAAFLDAYDDADTPSSGVPPLYKNFIAALHQARVEADEKYWVSVLGETQPSLLPMSQRARNTPTDASSRDRVEKKTVLYLPELKAQTLTAFCVQNGVTPASIVDAAWAQTLSIHTQSREVSFAYVDSGRDENIPSVSEVVGPLINILAYRLSGVSSE